MTTILDLGGAPANEPCAQLGQTPDFAALNLLEVDAYCAALVARHGPPPPGCRFETIVNTHDFGRYRTLGLAVATTDPAIGAYAEAVEDGLGSWLEAGFTPPVTYRGSIGHADRHDLAEIVIGALQTTPRRLRRPRRGVRRGVPAGRRGPVREFPLLVRRSRLSIARLRHLRRRTRRGRPGERLLRR